MWKTWNAHTPEYLHPYTKANVIWQLKLTGVLLVGLIGYEILKERREHKRLTQRNDSK